jgi:hypothetical protein
MKKQIVSSVVLASLVLSVNANASQANSKNNSHQKTEDHKSHEKVKKELSKKITKRESNDVSKMIACVY